MENNKVLRKLECRHSGVSAPFEFESDRWCVVSDDIPLKLIKDNNRGWTFINYTLTHRKVTFFYSRGDFEMLNCKK